MTITEIRTLLAFVKDGSLSTTSIGVYAYFLTKQGDVLTYSEMEADIKLSVNTLKKHITAMEKVHILYRSVNQRGLIIIIYHVKSWVPTRNSICTTSINSIYKKTMRKIVDDINSISSIQFTMKNVKTRTLIIARLNEGYTLADFKKVHRNMRYWLDDEGMAKYYRPATLYRPTKFPVHLEAVATGTNRLETTSKWETPKAKKKMAKRKDELRREFGVTKSADKV